MPPTGRLQEEVRPFSPDEGRRLIEWASDHIGRESGLGDLIHQGRDRKRDGDRALDRAP